VGVAPLLCCQKKNKLLWTSAWLTLVSLAGLTTLLQRCERYLLLHLQTLRRLRRRREDRLVPTLGRYAALAETFDVDTFRGMYLEYLLQHHGCCRAGCGDGVTHALLRHGEETALKGGLRVDALCNALSLPLPATPAFLRTARRRSWRPLQPLRRRKAYWAFYPQAEGLWWPHAASGNSCLSLPPGCSGSYGNAKKVDAPSVRFVLAVVPFCSEYLHVQAQAVGGACVAACWTIAVHLPSCRPSSFAW